MVAHVCDFGIAKLLGEEDSMTQTRTLATIGYMAPEYGSEGIVSARDLSSFNPKSPSVSSDMFKGSL
ncbi:hypothetical protein Q3G72_028563 [Acer saccharum]|nr:hypothetical protein Q3G72_028563 [Acer saccharum]